MSRWAHRRSSRRSGRGRRQQPPAGTSRLARLAVLLLVFPLFAQAQTHGLVPPDVEIIVPNSDTAALIEAVKQAQQDPSVEKAFVMGSGEYRFEPDQSLPAITGPVQVIIRPEDVPRHETVTLIGGSRTEPLARVAPDGKLALEFLEIAEFNLHTGGVPLIHNEGELSFHAVQFRNVGADVDCPAGDAACASRFGPAVSSAASAHLVMERMSLVDSGLFGSSHAGFEFPLVDNRGRLQIENAQFGVSRADLFPPVRNLGQAELKFTSWMAPRFSGSLITADSTGYMKLSHSIVEGFSAAWCGLVDTAGLNVVDSDECALDGPGDRAGVSAFLYWIDADLLPRDRVREGPWQDRLLIPVGASAAVDVGHAQARSLRDVSGHFCNDGDRAGGRGCDSGANEAPTPGLLNGGINGLYFVPEADGHYLTVQQLESVTLLTWNTFDGQGQPMWIYAVGQVTDQRSWQGTVYRNHGGRLLPGGGLAPADDQVWGRMALDLLTCDEAALLVRPDAPDLPTQTYRLKRLGPLSAVGCEQYAEAGR